MGKKPSNLWLRWQRRARWRLQVGVKVIEQAARYHKAYKVSLRWIKNYTDLDFRSLASYTRADFAQMAAEEDAF